MASWQDRPYLRIWFGLLALGIVLWLIVTELPIVTESIWITLGGILLAAITSPIADYAERWHIPRGVTVIVAYLAVLGILSALGLLLVPLVSSEVTQIQQNAPSIIQRAIQTISSISFLKGIVPSLSSVVQSLSQQISTILGTVVTTALSVSGFAVDVLVAIILGYFFAVDTGVGTKLVEQWLPPKAHDTALEVGRDLMSRLTRWAWARLAISVYYGIATGVGLAALGVPFALTIALVGAVLEIVPYVGTLAAVLAIVSALTIRPFLAVWVIVLYVVVDELKGHFLEPAFYGRAMGVHPAIALIALIIGLKAGGIIGVLFSLPVAVIVVQVLAAIRRAVYPSEELIVPGSDSNAES